MLPDDIFELYLKAGTSDVTMEELMELARHESPVIRMRVAENYHTPLATMILLAADEHPEVRCALSENRALPIFLMETLAEDEHDDVRYWIADNPLTPIFILGKLVLDRNCFVAERARKWFEASRAHMEILEFNFKDRSKSRASQSSAAC